MKQRANLKKGAKGPMKMRYKEGGNPKKSPRKYQGGNSPVATADPSRMNLSAAQQGSESEFQRLLREHNSKGDSFLEEMAEVFDPTGVSSWDDFYRARTAMMERGTGVPNFDETLDMLSAIPVLGKLGKFAKGVRAGTKAAPDAAAAGKKVWEAATSAGKRGPTVTPPPAPRPSRSLGQGRMAEGQAKANNAAAGSGPGTNPIVTPNPSANVPATQSSRAYSSLPNTNLPATQSSRAYSPLPSPAPKSWLDRIPTVNPGTAATIGVSAAIVGGSEAMRRSGNSNTQPPKSAAQRFDEEVAADKARRAQQAEADKGKRDSGQGYYRQKDSGEGYYRSDADRAAGRYPHATSSTQKPASSGSGSFNQAFAAARKAGQTTFTWNGKSYGTRRADETPEQYRAKMQQSAPGPTPKMETIPTRSIPTNTPTPELIRPAASAPATKASEIQNSQANTKSQQLKRKEPMKKKMGGPKKYQGGNSPAYDPTVDEYNNSSAVRGQAAADRYNEAAERNRNNDIERAVTPMATQLARQANLVASNKEAEDYSNQVATQKPKPSQGSSGFSQAFAAARKAGKTTFTYNGKSYGTRRANETPAAHKAAMARIAGESTPAAKSAPAPERMASRPAPSNRPEPQIQRPAASAPASPAKQAAPSTPASKKTGPVNEMSNLKQKSKTSKMKMGGSYLEPDKELKFGGMKYEMGGMMEECGPGRPCPNAKKAAKTKRNQHKNLSRGQRRYMR